MSWRSILLSTDKLSRILAAGTIDFLVTTTDVHLVVAEVLTNCNLSSSNFVPDSIPGESGVSRNFWGFGFLVESSDQLRPIDGISVHVIFITLNVVNFFNFFQGLLRISA